MPVPTCLTVFLTVNVYAIQHVASHVFDGENTMRTTSGRFPYEFDVRSFWPVKSEADDSSRSETTKTLTSTVHSCMISEGIEPRMSVR